ncbi:hypothetical protein CEXT_407121 [Caerostris extrusa]|uniref:Uncharacterized protein n=1 Tax=Caerostris extrusa TaxID=172846 RepID=A0AAV4QEK9_CAEEX|nr:hypothetical protein CEXT_407121 [Caerostris extrusa]
MKSRAKSKGSSLFQGLISKTQEKCPERRENFRLKDIHYHYSQKQKKGIFLRGTTRLSLDKMSLKANNNDFSNANVNDGRSSTLNDPRALSVCENGAKTNASYSRKLGKRTTPYIYYKSYRPFRARQDLHPRSAVDETHQECPSSSHHPAHTKVIHRERWNDTANWSSDIRKSPASRETSGRVWEAGKWTEPFANGRCPLT